MGIYKGHRVALREKPGLEEQRLVHYVVDVMTWRDAVKMTCGETTASVVAVEHLTGAPLSCVWCIAGTRRYDNLRRP